MKKRKVLYMNMGWIRGGIEAYMWNIFEHIDYDRYTIDLVLPGETRWPIEASLESKGIRVIHYPTNTLAQHVKSIKEVLSAGDYDIVHVMQNYLSWETHTVFALVALAERRHHHYKVICHSHGAEDNTKQVTFSRRIIRSVFRSILRWSFSRADLLAACSMEAGKFVYGTNEVKILNNGIDLGKFWTARTSCSVTQWRRKYGIDENKLNFITVARMEEEKNPMFILDVIHSLSEYYPNVNMTWVGTGKMRENIEDYAEELCMKDRLHLVGAQDHVEEILACCDYCILPSKREGAPVVLIEAQAAGLTCFASDRVPNVIDCGGVTFIPLEKTAAQWAEEIHRQIETEPKVNIDIELLKQFDINRTVADLSEVYNSLVEQ